MKKSDILLHVYHTLLISKTVSKHDVMAKFGISSLRFARYLSDIRSYFVREGLPYQIVYERKVDRYYLLKIR